MVSNIWVAAADNQISVVEKLIDSGIAPDVKDPNGYTPIHAAASYGHTDLLAVLINRNGNVNVQDNEGDTPLHHVEDINTAKYLVEELKADFKVKNDEGQTAAQYIEEEGEFPDLAVYLRSLDHEMPQNSSSAHLSSVGQSESVPEQSGSILALLPATTEGHQIRYTMEDDQGDMDEDELEERRKKLEAIVNSENPEEALRELVTAAVRDGLAEYSQETEPSSNKRSRN